MYVVGGEVGIGIERIEDMNVVDDLEILLCKNEMNILPYCNGYCSVFLTIPLTIMFLLCEQHSSALLGLNPALPPDLQSFSGSHMHGSYKCVI